MHDMNEMKKRGLICFLTFLLLLAFGGCKKEKQEPFFYRAPSQKQVTEEKTDETDKKEYVVRELNMADETITVLSTQTGRLTRCKYDLGTKFLDKYGNNCSAVHFSVGQVVKLGEKDEKSVLESVQLSDEVWVYEDVQKYSIDVDRGVFTIGETNYRMTDKLVIYSGDAEMSPDALGEDDTLQVIGKDKDIISVVVTTGHGYIQLVNSTLFQDSMICIGNRIFTTITGDMKLEVPEGTYAVTVANNGYGGTAEYTVTRNETTTIDLNELKGSGPKLCKLKFESEVAGVSVYVDGKQITVGEETEVTYGAHKLSVVAEGYESWQKTLVVNSESATIALDLAEEEKASDTQKENQTTEKESTDGEKKSSTATENSTSSSVKKETGSDSSADKSSDTDKSSKKLSDSEVDYLTTISKMLEHLLD